jgi:hypothetical protein
MFEVVLDGTDAIGASAATAFPGGDAFEERTALLRRQLAGGRHDDPQSERRSTRWIDELWRQSSRGIFPNWHLCRKDSQGSEARRPAGMIIDRRHQPSRMLRRRRQTPEKTRNPEAHAAFIRQDTSWCRNDGRQREYGDCSNPLDRSYAIEPEPFGMRDSSTSFHRRARLTYQPVTR